VALDYQDQTPRVPDHGHLPTTDPHGAGVADIPGRGSRSADDILQDGPNRTSEMLPEGWRDRPDAELLAQHGLDLDEHELRYRVALREAKEQGKDAKVLGAAKAKITEAEGERAATKYMVENFPDAELYRGFNAGVGYDQVWVRKVDGKIREYIIVEAKGPGAELLEGGKKGLQMSNEWVTKTAQKMKESGDHLGDEILEALEQNDVVVHGRLIEADGVGGAIEHDLPDDIVRYTRYGDDPEEP